jgi:Domain of unknown function (DUF4351)
MTAQKPRSNDPHDKFIKQLLPVVLKNLFNSQTSVSVELAEELAIDVLCKAIQTDNVAELDPALGLLGRLMAVHPTVIVEHYSGYLDLEDIDSCVLRSAMYWEMHKGQSDGSTKIRVTKDSALNQAPLHPNQPFTWILAAKCGENSLRRWMATRATEFGEYVYWLGPPGLSMGLVEIESLPSTTDTLLLKMMGKADSAKQAFDDIVKLDPGLELRNDIIEVSIKHCIYLQQFQSELTEEALSFMVYIQEVEQAYQQWVKERRAEGKIEGEAALVVKLLSRKIGVLSPAMLVQINSLSLEQVEALGEALLDFTGIEDLVAWLAN